MTIGEGAHLLEEPGMTGQERTRILRKMGCTLLEEIHSKQHLPDRLDDLLHEMQKQEWEEKEHAGI